MLRKSLSAQGQGSLPPKTLLMACKTVTKAGTALEARVSE